MCSGDVLVVAVELCLVVAQHQLYYQKNITSTSLQLPKNPLKSISHQAAQCHSTIGSIMIFSGWPAGSLAHLLLCSTFKGIPNCQLTSSKNEPSMVSPPDSVAGTGEEGSSEVCTEGCQHSWPLDWLMAYRRCSLEGRPFATA